MQAWFWCQARFVLGASFLNALPLPDADRDYRAALCRFEDDLFARYPDGHRILGEAEAHALIASVFTACGRAVPSLDLVDGFADPRIGGFADVEGNRIMIERGCLYRFLTNRRISSLRRITGTGRSSPTCCRCSTALSSPSRNTQFAIFCCATDCPATPTCRRTSGSPPSKSGGGCLDFYRTSSLTPPSLGR